MDKSDADQMDYEKCSTAELVSQYRCGFGACTPNWLQRWHNSRCLLLVISLCGFVQGFVVGGVFPVGLSTVERRFNLQSKQTGFLASWYDVAMLLAVFPVCHYGNKGHKGRWVGVGMLMVGVGSLLCGLAHFLGTDDSALLPWAFGGMSKAYLLFFLARTLSGFGATPLLTVGTAYIDENVSQQASPVYLAFNSLLQSLGPIAGLLCGALTLSVREDFYADDESPTNGSGFGAWWIGFLVAGVAACLVALLMLAFGRTLPEAEHQRSKDVEQVHANSAISNDKKAKLRHQIMGLLRNPTFMAGIGVGAFDSIVVNGFGAFMPKIFETLLTLSTGQAAITSVMLILAAAGGVVCGGILIRKMQLQVKGMLMLVIVGHAISFVFQFAFMLHCPQSTVVGPCAGDYGGVVSTSSPSSLSFQCIEGCDCAANWNPICGDDEVTYCNAQCAALSFNLTMTPNSDSMPAGVCSPTCNLKWPLLALLFLGGVFGFATHIPAQQIMLRVIPFDQRLLGIAISWLLMRLLGFIPGGVLFGMAVDSACRFWQSGDDDVATACLAYDAAALSNVLLLIIQGCKIAAVAAAIIGYLSYRPLVNNEKGTDGYLNEAKSESVIDNEHSASVQRLLQCPSTV